jgi:nucleoside-diphosphate-sugar epimerase
MSSTELRQTTQPRLPMTAMKISDPAIPFGSTVVVIGANGYIALETCMKLLEAGFRVRGTVRDVQTHRAWMHKLFDTTWPSMFELVQVPDFEADKAFDVAFQGPYPSKIYPRCAPINTGSPATGAAGVIYVSTPVLFDTDPAKVIAPTVNGTINNLEAAARAGVKRYVLAGSSKAIATTTYNVPYNLSTRMYNYDSILNSISPPIDETPFERSLTLYTAGRTLAELAFWSWVARNKPSFTANCVVPDGNFGRVLTEKDSDANTKSSTGALKAALAGQWEAAPLKMGTFFPLEKHLAWF